MNKWTETNPLNIDKTLVFLRKTLENKTIKFLNDIEEFDLIIDENMIGVVENIIKYDNEGTYEFHINLEKYYKHNKKCMKRNYFNKFNEAVLTAEETGCWTDIETLLINLFDAHPNNYFEIINQKGDFTREHILEALIYDLTFNMEKRNIIDWVYLSDERIDEIWDEIIKIKKDYESK